GKLLLGERGGQRAAAVVGAPDRCPRGAPEASGVVAKDGVREAVGRGGRYLARDLVAKLLGEALAHLAGGVVHECQRAVLLWAGAAGGDQPAHPLDPGPSLAGAGTSDDLERSFGMGRRLVLWVVERRQVSPHVG